MAEFKSGWPTSFNKTNEHECGIDDFNQEKHQAGRKASVWHRIDLHTSHMSPTVYRDSDITDVISRLVTFPSASIIIWWEWCYACSIEGSPEDLTPSWTIKSDPMSAGCCHHRWMCHVVNRALAHEWHRGGLCDQLRGCHHISHGTPWRLPDIWRNVGNSTKQMTKSSRSGNDASRKHQLSLHTTLPAQNVALNVVHNKVQLINCTCHYLINPNPTPVQVGNRFSLQSEDLKTNHKEADVINLHHVVIIASEASDDSYIKVVCSDIDHVFVQLIRFYLEKNMTMNDVSMEIPCAGRTIISTKQHWNTSISPNVCLPTRPDRVWYGIISLFGIEKATALKVLVGRHHLIELDQHGADEDKLTSKSPSLLPVTDPQLKEPWILTVTRCGRLKSWTLSGMDGMQAMMAHRCIQPHLQLVSLLYR